MNVSEQTRERKVRVIYKVRLTEFQIISILFIHCARVHIRTFVYACVSTQLKNSENQPLELDQAGGVPDTVYPESQMPRGKQDGPYWSQRHRVLGGNAAIGQFRTNRARTAAETYPPAIEVESPLKSLRALKGG